MPDVWGIAAILAKYAMYLGILTSVGTVFARIVLGQGVGPVRRIAIGWAVLGLVFAVLVYMLRGAALTGNAAGMVDPDMLSLLWQTPVGSALLLRVIGLGLLILGAVVAGAGLWLAAAGGMIALWSFAQIGHVPDQDRAIVTGALMVHLMAVSFWIGILTPLRRLALTPGQTSAAADLGLKFGQIAAIVVPLLIVAGGIMAYALVGSLAGLMQSAYGRLVLLKVAFVAVLLGLAAANKLRFVPAMQVGDASAAPKLAGSIALEWGIIHAIVLTTAIFTTTLTPPQ